MATTREFSAMLNEYLPVSLMKQELEKRMWLFNECVKDDTWLGGQIILPFEGACASSVSFGSLTASNDVAEDELVRGTISAYAEVWSTLLLRETDLLQHGKISEQNFLKIIPGRIDAHVGLLKQRISLQMLNNHASKAVTDGTAGGLIQVEFPERFQRREKVFVDDDNSVAVAGYVREINTNSATLTIYDARTGGAPVDLSPYTVLQNAKLFYSGSQPGVDAGFTSLRSQLLSAANGGAASHFGVTKAATPYLQALNINGSTITEANLLDRIFAGYSKVASRSGGMPNRVVMSYKNLMTVMKNLETSKGPYHIDQKSSSVESHYWAEISVMSVRGSLKLVGVPDMDNDLIYYLDPKSIKFYSNGTVRRRTSPDGQSFHPERSTSGFTYLIDHVCFGQLVCEAPSNNGVIWGVNFALAGTDDTGA